ncbi:MAG TPA: hypothetical protein VMW38_22745 [Terriglobia bacterium]|nr:hypothetical protein [Terriglobia bacterium]
MSAALIIAVLLIASGVSLISFLLLLRNESGRFTESSTGKESPTYGNCYDICKGDSEEASDQCIALCAYGWP